jgi:phosphoribosylanthranilate isomerase
MKIKVCGNSDLQQLEELSKIGIDYAGFIFYEQSSRYILDKITGKELRDANLSLEKVGVFVNASEEEIMKQVEEYDLQIVQLHGDETAGFCNRISDHIKVIKAFRLSNTVTNIDWLVKEYQEACDYYLFDNGSTGLYGGTGEKFDWNILSNSNVSKPFFLSGGISIGDIEKLKSFEHQWFYGVDINSKFETEPGIKNLDLLREFVIQVKK